MWSTWDRWRRAVAIVAAVFAALVAVGLLFPTDVWNVELDGDGLTLRFLQEASEDAGPLLGDDFSRATGAWNERREQAAVVAIGDGVLHVRLLEEGTFDFEAPHATIGELDAVHVEATTRVVSGGPAAVVGLFCAVSGGADAELVGAAGGYVFMLHPETRTARIGRVPAPLQSGFAQASLLRQGQVPASSLDDARTRIAADCDESGGARSLVLSVDGRPVLSAASRRSDRAFDSAGVVAVHAGGAGEVAVDFDDYSVSGER